MCYSIFILQIVVCPFVLFLLAIVMSVFRFTDSEYPFSVFKIFLQRCWFLSYLYATFGFTVQWKHFDGKQGMFIVISEVNHATFSLQCMYQDMRAVPDLPLCLGVLKHWAQLASWWGGIFQLKKNYDGFLVMWGNFEGVLFRGDSKHQEIVDNIWQCATKPVAQWHRNQIIRGPHSFTSTGPHLS